MTKSKRQTFKTLAVLAGLVGYLLLGGCSSAPELQKAGTHNIQTSYIIGPGDSLNIFVWGNGELSSTVPVRPDGKITTPLIEDVQASGKTPTRLARDMEKHLAKYIKNPIVTVIVRGFEGRYSEQVRVVGEAVKPQALPYRANMTLLDLIIEVGGLTEFASGNSAKLIRNVEGGQQQEYELHIDDLVRSGDISANVDILPGDIIIIPETWF